MKPHALVLAGLLALPAAAFAAGETPAPAAGALQDNTAKAAYALGLNIGRGLKHDGVAVDPKIILRGLEDGLGAAKPALSEEEMRAALTTIQSEVQARRKEAAAKAGETNKAEGAAFLKANAAKSGVVSLPSGLQYEIIKAGTGPKPKADDTVQCNYRGTLINGTVFDSSDSHGGPASFPLNGVIKGWTEALQLMPVGSKWRLFVPADLAYGEHGAGQDIGPNATLVFEVELVSIQPKA